MKLFGVFALVAVGAVCLWAAWWRWQSTMAYYSDGERTTGILVGYEEGTRTVPGGSNRPGAHGGYNTTEKTVRWIVEFTAQGRTDPLRFTSGLSLDPTQTSVGSTVPVLYRRSDPIQAQIDSVKSQVGTPLILLGLGLAAFFAALYATLWG